MKVFQVPYEQLQYWSHTDLAYIRQDSLLEAYQAYAPSLQVIPDVITNRKKFPVDRTLLWDVIKSQYENLRMELPLNADSILNENAFTITTAHQPTLLTGPLYHIYKIASTIHVANDLNALHPFQTFIPVFIVGAEDHDWDEVNHLHIFGRRFEWERDASGPCGRLSVEGLRELISLVSELFSNNPFGEEITQLLESALQKSTTYGAFHQLLIHHLFGHLGLVVLSMDDARLKKAFIPLMEREIRTQFSMPYVTTSQTQLEALGFKPQAYCRPVNLFYMTEGRRERLEPSPEGLLQVDNGISRSIEDVVAELHAHPERFSPNVIMRPLYQELILPNLAYIGGGGEIAYWLERKSQFEAAGIHFPMLIRRNSLMLIDESTSKQLAKADLDWKDLLQDYDSIARAYVLKHSESDLDFEKEQAMIKQAYELLARKAETLDPTLAKAIKAEESKQSKAFEQLGSRLMRTEKQHQETNLKRIQKLKDKLFPDGGLQERHENFLSFYATHGKSWIEQIVDVCDPFDGQFKVVEWAS